MEAFFFLKKNPTNRITVKPKNSTSGYISNGIGIAVKQISAYRCSF